MNIMYEQVIKLIVLQSAKSKNMECFIKYVCICIPYDNILLGQRGTFILRCFLFCKEDVTFLQGALKNC